MASAVIVVIIKH